MSSLKILQLCAKPPRPLLDGGCIAMNAMTVGLKMSGHEVHTIAITTDKHPGSPTSSAELKRELASYQECYVDTAVKPLGALINLLKGTSYNISRFEDEGVKDAIREVLSGHSFDVVLLESLFMLPYLKVIRENSNAKAVLRAHNVEHQIWEGVAEDAGGGLKGWYLQALARQLKDYEVKHLNDVDAILPITEEDREVFRKLGANVEMHVVPFSMEFKENTEQATVDHVFHFGSMDWKPNQDGVRWLLDEVWPRVREENDSVTLVLAGRHIPSEFKSNPDLGIDVVGEVDDAWEFLQRPGIMTIPVRSGSGMRIKAIEGMAAGRPLVSTTLGAMGVGVVSGENAMIADSAEEFSNSILRILEKEGDLGKKGSEFVRNQFSIEIISRNLSSFLNNTLLKK